MKEAFEAGKCGKWKSLHIKKNAKLTTIPSKAFLTSLVGHMNDRCLTSGSGSDTLNNKTFLAALEILIPANWPDTIPVRYGEEEVKLLSKRFGLDSQQCIEGFRDFVESRKSTPKLLLPLVRAVETIPCSSAECERSFSLMNLIVTSLRSSLLIESVSSIMFLKMNGPPLKDFKPDEYVKQWLLAGHRDACDTRTRGGSSAVDALHSEKQTLWKLL